MIFTLEYAKGQRLGKPNNIKHCVSTITKGLNSIVKNWLRILMLEGREPMF